MKKSEGNPAAGGRIIEVRQIEARKAALTVCVSELGGGGGGGGGRRLVLVGGDEEQE